tara:strand:+ start:29 stop:412 length:384 start_codon:yes stop_codon:yes gene_type:complete
MLLKHLWNIYLYLTALLSVFSIYFFYNNNSKINTKRINMAIVKIPTPLRALTENKTEIQINGKTIIEVIDNLDSLYIGIKDKILDNGKLKHFVNVYVNGEDIRYIDSLETSIDNNDEISIVPAVAGG